LSWVAFGPAEKTGMPMLKNYYVYIMAIKSRTLYTGVTSNLERRVFEHRDKLLPGFTARYSIYRLVYYEVFGENRRRHCSRETN
jgi:putative endonuclease